MIFFGKLQAAIILAVVQTYSLAQDIRPAEQRPLPEETKPLAAKTNGFAVPLTIDQIRSNIPTTSAADKFEFLRNQRKTTLDAISSIAALLSTVDAKLKISQTRRLELDAPRVATAQGSRLSMPKDRWPERIKMLSDDFKQASKRYEDARARNAPKQEQETLRDSAAKAQYFLADAQDSLNSLELGEKREADRLTKLKAAEEELQKLATQRDELYGLQTSYQRLLGSLDDMVNQLFIASDATNSFKLKMSIAFSILVGVVIVGFFGIAWSNDEIKKTIFANEAGIQFITIFSIVIAVILFGIIGVLESKELSALLGGLSGYILGKGRPTQPAAA